MTILEPTQVHSMIKKYGLQIVFPYNISKNFTYGEVLIHQTDVPTLDILKNLQKTCFTLNKYRDTLFGGNKIKITSGWRSPRYNKQLRDKGYKTAINSFHIKGMALDFIVDTFDPKEVYEILDKVHLGGLENAPTWTHIDIRNSKVRF